MPALAVDDDVIVRLGADLVVPNLDLAVVDVEVGAGYGAGRMLLRGSNINQEEALGRWGGPLIGGFCQAGLQLLDRQEEGMIGQNATAGHQHQKERQP
jgi:hypothetical protein